MAKRNENRANEWQPSNSGETDIPLVEWAAFLERFSREHQGDRVAISLVSGDRKSTETVNCQLQRIAAEPTSTTPELRVSAECDEGKQVEHAIIDPVRLISRRDAGGADQGIEIIASDGAVTRVRLWVAVRRGKSRAA
jgi:hypothetical protein